MVAERIRRIFRQSDDIILRKAFLRPVGTGNLRRGGLLGRLRALREIRGPVGEVFSDDGLAVERNSPEEGDLLVRRRGDGGRFHEPGRPGGIPVIQGCILSAQDDILGIQRVEYRRRGQGLLRLRHGLRFADRAVDAVDLLVEVAVDEVLVALELRRGIAADRLVVIGRDGGVEDIHGQVEHPVGRVRVGLDHLVHGPLGERPPEVLRRGEVTVVEVALAGGEHIDQHEDTDGRTGNRPPPGAGEGLRVVRLSLREQRPEQEQERHGNQQEGGHRVVAEEHLPVGDEGIDEDIRLAGVHGAGEVAGEGRDEPHDQAEARRQRIRQQALPAHGLRVVLLFQDPVEDEEPEHREGVLQDDEGHRHRPELAVERQDGETEFGEGHEMVAEGHEDRHEGRGQQPPPLASLIKEEPQQEEEHGNRAHVHRSRRERLRPPVHRQMLRRLPEVALARAAEQGDGRALVGVHRRGGGAAVEVRDHQVGQFLPAVGPRGRIVEVQPLRIVPLAAQFGTAAHRVRLVLVQGQEFVDIGGDADAAEHKQQGRGRDKAPEGLFPPREHVDEQHDGIDQDDEGEVIGDLLVVGLDLETDGKGEKRGAEHRLRQPAAPESRRVLAPFAEC